MDRFLEALARTRGADILVLCHDDADSDALGAAFALADLVDGTLAVPAKVSEHARELQFKLEMDVLTGPNPEDYDLVILVDTADVQQLPGCVPKRYLLIDHHPDNKLIAAAEAYYHRIADSTCQLVWEIYQARDQKPRPAIALALGAGIMGDTRYLATAANNTIAQLAEILAAGGVNYHELMKTMQVTSRIDREVRLQAALTAKLQQVGNCLVVTTTAERNYVYYVAMMLLELGADISLVGFQQNQDCYIRLAKSPATAHCLNLASILASAVDGLVTHNLWGSPDFAGFNGQARVEDVSRLVLQNLESVQHTLGLCQCSVHGDIHL